MKTNGEEAGERSDRRAIEKSHAILSDQAFVLEIASRASLHYRANHVTDVWTALLEARFIVENIIVSKCAIRDVTN